MAKAAKSRAARPAASKVRKAASSAKRSARGRQRPPVTGAPTGGTPAIPADARAASDSSLDKIQIGNRSFFAQPTKIATPRGKRKLDILPDMPDIRDRPYIPHLRPLHAGIYPSIAFQVRDQGLDSSCTGYSLAHVIDFLRHRTTNAEPPQRASARMLYEMAKKNDEWAGSNYEGSSSARRDQGLLPQRRLHRDDGAGHAGWHTLDADL